MTAPECPYNPDDQVEFAYGEMDPKSAEAFRAHLESCPACRAAVLKLSEAARLTKKVRSAPIPQAKWEKGFPVPDTGRQPGWWRRPVVWAPVAAAACAFILFFVLRPTPAPLEPVQPPPDSVTPPVLPEEPPPVFARVIRTTGQVTKTCAETESPLSIDGKIPAGDSLTASTRSTALLQLDDQTQILVGEKSTVHFEALGQKGDRLLLRQGHVACRVTPRQADRVFLIDAGLGSVKVTGTLFAVLKVGEKKLMVGVHQGAVDVNGFAVRAGRQLTLEKKKAKVRLAALGKKMRGLMQPFLPETPPAPAKDTPPAVEEEQPKPQEPPEKEVKAEPKKEAPDTLASLVENMYKDTSWIFDDLRADIARGEWEVVLHRLENYLADPESPSRDEAIFLKAVCLEKLGRIKEAHQAYRNYLIKWPAGNRANKAKHGLIRTRKAR